MISVVIPAHNEAEVLSRLLSRLAPDGNQDDFQVVVVPNGCTDATADIARQHGVDVVVVAQASKIAALNAGDAHATGFPRFYVDADIVVDQSDIRALAYELEAQGLLAIAPKLEMDTRKSTWLVRSYFRYWSLLPSVQHSLAGRGCICVSGDGRARWDEFPDVIADDQFVNVQFEDGETGVADQVTSGVMAPRTVRALLRRKRRSHRGNLQLAEIGHDTTSRTTWTAVARKYPNRLVDAPAFVALTALVRLSTRIAARQSDTDWGVDSTSRA